MQAMGLFACMAASWMSSPSKIGSDLIAAYSPGSALDSLPFTLPALMTSKLWQPCIGIIADQLLAVLQSHTTELNDDFHERMDPIVCPPVRTMHDTNFLSGSVTELAWFGRFGRR